MKFTTAASLVLLSSIAQVQAIKRSDDPSESDNLRRRDLKSKRSMGCDDDTVLLSVEFKIRDEDLEFAKLSSIFTFAYAWYVTPGITYPALFYANSFATNVPPLAQPSESWATAGEKTVCLKKEACYYLYAYISPDPCYRRHLGEEGRELGPGFPIGCGDPVDDELTDYEIEITYGDRYIKIGGEDGFPFDAFTGPSGPGIYLTFGDECPSGSGGRLPQLDIGKAFQEAISEAVSNVSVEVEEKMKAALKGDGIGGDSAAEWTPLPLAADPAAP